MRIGVVTSVRLYRDGLAALLSSCTDIQVVGTAASADDELQALLDAGPDLLLVESSMVHALSRCDLKLRSNATMLAFAVAEEQADEALACAKSGVAGFLGRDASLEELLTAIRCARGGGIHCSPSIAGLFIRHVANQPVARSGRSDAALTARENEVLDLIGLGLCNKEIARRLGIESATVKNHVHNLLEKLHVRRRGQAAALNQGRSIE